MPRYTPEVFFQVDEQKAREIILTPDGGMTTDERWERETAWISGFLEFREDALVIDYGCGIGRLSKVIKRPVLGVDLSPTMRQHAIRYVDRQEFGVVSPTMLQKLARQGLRCGGAVCVWVLQHVVNPDEVIGDLSNALCSRAPLYVLNLSTRCVPTDAGWFDDGVHVDRLLDQSFKFVREIELPPELAALGAYFRLYEKRARWWKVGR
jgi:SAM-dependent methyltransferase